MRRVGGVHFSNVAVTPAMDTSSPSACHSWFRSRDGHRFGIEFALIVLVKIALLVVIWYLLFAPQPRPDTSPAAVARHLLAPAADSGASHD